MTIIFKHLDSCNQNGLICFIREKMTLIKHSKMLLSSKRAVLHNLALGSQVQNMAVLNRAGSGKQVVQTK